MLSSATDGDRPVVRALASWATTALARCIGVEGRSGLDAGAGAATGEDVGPDGETAEEPALDAEAGEEPVLDAETAEGAAG